MTDTTEIVPVGLGESYLPKEAFSAAMSVTEELDRRNLNVSAVEGTPLYALVSQMGSISGPVLNEREDDIAKVVTDSSRNVIVDSVEMGFGQTLDELSGTLISAVASHLTFARNVVNPMITELHKNVVSSIEAMPGSVSFNPVIQEVDLPEPLLTSAMLSDIGKYEDVRIYNYSSNLSLPVLENQEIIEALKTGLKTVDDTITKWVVSMGEEYFTRLFVHLFTIVPTNTPSLDLDGLQRDKFTGSNGLLAAYLLTNSLIDNPPQGTKMSAQAYRTAMAELQDQAAARLVALLKERERNLQSELMYLGGDKNVVYVFSPVYQSWLAEGGQIGVLLGNVLTNRPQYYKAAISENSVEYLSVWERQNRLLNQTYVNRRNDLVREHLSINVNRLIQEHLNDFVEVTGENPTFASPIIQKSLSNAQGYIDQLQTINTPDLWEYCSDIVAGEIFYYTDAKKILYGIEMAFKMNPEISPTEAAYLSTVEYITDYIASQLKVENSGIRV